LSGIWEGGRMGDGEHELELDSGRWSHGFVRKCWILVDDAPLCGQDTPPVGGGVHTVRTT